MRKDILSGCDSQGFMEAKLSTPPPILSWKDSPFISPKMLSYMYQSPPPHPQKTHEPLNPVIHNNLQ